MRTLRIAAALLSGLLWISCNFTEEIHLNEDGSGTIALSFDGSQLLSLTDSTAAAEQPKRLDSVVRFSDVLDEKKDSIRKLPPAEQERLEKLRPYEMRMITDHEAGEMRFILSREFRDISEVGNAFNAFQDAGALDPAPGENTPMKSAEEVYPSTEVVYSLKGNTFTRRGFIVDSVLHQQRIDSLKGGESFLAESTYKLEVHFPRKIRSASVENATLSMDGKTLFYEVGLLNYLLKPDALDLEVILEE
ncbi:MAG: hypothetical protein P8Z38_08285 [Robiginitalea sp.]